MKIEIRSPKSEQEWEAYYSLRFEVLRKPLNQPVGSERNSGDSHGKHFALFHDCILRAVARLDKADENVSQVRFVAVDSSTQGRGYGKMIMNAIEQESKNTGNIKMILHARDYAVEFYLKQNYSVVEKSYKLFGTLQHFLMEKVY